MVEIYENEAVINDPDWREDRITVTFTFRDGLTKSVTVDTVNMSEDEINNIRQQILGKRKLIQSIMEHNTHGQITIKGLTVRADDLITVSIV